MLKVADTALNSEGIQISSPSEDKLNLRLVCFVGNFRSSQWIVQLTDVNNGFLVTSLPCVVPPRGNYQ
jgi:hypothetical protein